MWIVVWMRNVHAFVRTRKVFFGLLLLWPAFVAAAELTIAFGAEPVQVDPTRSSAGVDGYYTDLFYERKHAGPPVRLSAS